MYLPVIPLITALAEIPSVQPGEETVTRPILGFVALLALAYLAGRPELARLEKKLALNPVVTSSSFCWAGLPPVVTCRSSPNP